MWTKVEYVMHTRWFGPGDLFIDTSPHKHHQGFHRYTVYLSGGEIGFEGRPHAKEIGGASTLKGAQEQAALFLQQAEQGKLL